MSFDLNQINVIPRKKSAAEQFMGGFNQGPSVDELVKPFVKQKAAQQEALGKLLDYHERSGRERLKKYFDPGEEFDSEQINKMHKRAKKLLAAGLPENEAYFLATRDDENIPAYLRQLLDVEGEEEEDLSLSKDLRKQEKKLSEKEGGLAQLLMGNAEDRGVKEALQERMMGERPPLSEMQGGLLQKLLGTGEPRTALEHPGQIGRGFLDFVKEKQKRSEKLSQSKAPLSIYNIEEKEPISEEEKKAREAGYRMGKGISETARVLLEGELLGTGIGLALRGVSRAFPALANRMASSIKSFAKRFGKSEAKVAEEITSLAEKEGVDLAKVAAGDRAESARLAKITQDYPRGQAARIKRGFKRAEKAPPRAKQEQLVERQAKEAPKYEKEISEYKGERAARRAKREKPATDRGRMAKMERHKTGELRAQKILPALEKDAAQVKKLEGMLDKSKDAKEIPFLKKRLKDAVSKRDQLQREYDLARAQQITGSNARLTPRQMTKNAEEKVHKLLKDIKDGEEIRLLKWDYNPERIKAAKEAPSTPVSLKNNYLQQVHSAYGEEYKKALSEIRKNLGRKNISPEHRAVLKRQEDVLDKMIEHINADRRLNQHQQSLVQMGKRARVAEKIKTAQPVTKGVAKTPEQFKVKARALRTEKPAQRVLGKLSDKEAEKIVTQAKVHKASEITTDTVKKTTENLGKASEKASQKVTGNRKISQIKANWEDLRKALKSRNMREILKTQLGKDIVIQLISEGWNEFINKNEDIPIKIPFNTFITATIGRSPTRILTRLGISGLVSTGKILWNDTQTKQYADALRNGNRKKMKEIFPKLTPKQVKKAKEQAFGRKAA